jgi:hypothetical protein
MIEIKPKKIQFVIGLVIGCTTALPILERRIHKKRGGR